MATSPHTPSPSSTIMSARTLATIIDRPNTVPVDCRWYLDDLAGGEAAYRAGHLPGARYVSLDDDLSGPVGAGRHPLPTPEAFADTCASLGISSSSVVVAYDDRGGAIAARLWWMLTNQGHTNTYVLDGGVQAWVDQSGTLTADVVPPAGGSFSTRPWTRTVTRDEVRDRGQRTVVIDARGADRFRGEAEPIDASAGHIPGALSVPMTGNLNEDLTFRSREDLRISFEGSDITHETHVMSHCGSGVTACHNILAMTIAGMDNVDLYVGSWSDWSTAGFPVATGDEGA